MWITFFFSVVLIFFSFSFPPYLSLPLPSLTLDSGRYSFEYFYLFAYISFVLVLLLRGLLCWVLVFFPGLRQLQSRLYPVCIVCIDHEGDR